MPFRIQRAAYGLLNLLGINGAQTPTELEDRVRAAVELTQIYGLQQRQLTFVNDPALAENGAVSCVPAAQSSQLKTKWAVLFGASFGGIKTATMTALQVSVEMQRGGAQSISLASKEFTQFGATVTGAAGCAFWAPYPILLMPPWDVFGRLQILGTDATANMTCIAEIGILQ